jgi:YD repeat-containing protein
MHKNRKVARKKQAQESLKMLQSPNGLLNIFIWWLSMFKQTLTATTLLSLVLFCLSVSTFATTHTNSNHPLNPTSNTNQAPNNKLITIAPHTRSASVNAKHASECSAMGGVDVTDDMQLQISKSVVDSVVCQINNLKTYAKYAKSKGITYYKNTKNLHEEVDFSNYELGNSLVSVFAPNGVFGDFPYYSTGVIIFSSNSAGMRYDGSYRVSNDWNGSNPCYTYLTGGYVVPSGGRSFVLGMYCSGNPGKHQSRTDGSVNSNQVVDYGVIEHPSSANYVEIPKNLGFPENLPGCNIPTSFIGNPINIAIGNKFQQEIDLANSGNYPLSFIRYYNSADNGTWINNYSQHIEKSNKSSNEQLYKVFIAGGKEVDFIESNNTILPAPTELGVLKKITTGYQYTSPWDETLEFDNSGQLTRTINSVGLIHNISYNPNTITVSDDFKHNLIIKLNNNNQPVSVISSSGKTIHYIYDALGRLAQVNKNGKSRIYHYEDARFPNVLTGITNERGIRYITWTYDDKARANSSTNFGDINKISVTYDSNSQTTFTNPLGRKYLYNYTVIDGVKRISSINGIASSLCPKINSIYQYDDKGLLVIKTDGKDVKTTYEYNDKGQETSRTIAAGTSEALTIKTSWDERFFNKPKTETYPNKTLNYTYDNDGNLTSVKIKTN